MEKILLTTLAKPNSRYIASIIDAIVIAIIILPMFIYSRVAEITEDKMFYFSIAFFLYKLFIYLLVDYLIPLITKGKTIGRYFMGLRLVKRNGDYANSANYLRRTSIFILVALLSDILYLPTIAYILWCAVFVVTIYLIYNDDYRMTVHDKVANTMVIKDTNIFTED